MAETIIIHNYAGVGGGGPLEEIPVGKEVGRIDADMDMGSWMWHPTFNHGQVDYVDINAGKTYIIYEVEE